MDAQGAGIRGQLSDALTELTGLVDKLQQKAMESPAIDNSSGQQQRVEIKLDAGKFSAWAAAGVCLVVLAFFSGAAVTAGFWFSREFTKIDGRFSDAKNNDDIHDLQVQKLETRIERISQQKQEKK